MTNKVDISVTVNGERVTGSVEPRTLLADFLRDGLGLKGTHLGCEHGICGACTVLLDGEAVRSCLTFAVQVAGHSITTVESLSKDGELNPLQKAFLENDALQCGFCTPGVLMTILGYMNQHKGRITEEQAREAISGNICRCTGYEPIVKAVVQFALQGGAIER